MKKETIYITLVAAVLLTGCGHRHEAWPDGDATAVDGLRTLDRQLTVGMQQDGDSVLRVIDSLETAGQLPSPLGDYERAVCYSVMDKRRIGEFYYKKALEADRLRRLWPEAYFRASANLAILLSDKNDLQGAMRVATEAHRRMKDYPEAAASRWLPALLFSIGAAQLRLGHGDEGLATLAQCMTLMETIASKARTSENLRTWATLAVNAATVVSETDSDSAVPWIARADEVVRQLPLSREIPGALIDMLRGKTASLMAIYCVGHDRPGDAEQAYRNYLETDYSKQPVAQVERLNYLEKAGRWDEAAQLLPDLMAMQKGFGQAYTMDYLQLLAEGFTVYRMAGQPAKAVEAAMELAEAVDSVKEYQKRDAAAELAVIYETQQKEEQIYRQQWRLRRQQGAAVALILTVIILSLAAYNWYRRRAARRLKAAYDLLQERNGELETAKGQAEESSRMKTKFIQQISHEIRTPLNILSGFTQVLTSPGVELDELELADINRRIKDNTERITRTVNKMLELSEAGSQTVTRREDTVAAMEIAEQAVAASDIRRACHVDFTLVTAGAEDLTLLTNRQNAVRALAQLLDNAAKFTRAATESDNLPDAVPARKEQVRLTVGRDGSLVVFAVEDTGCGVPPGEAEHIFAEFVQLDEFYEGTGLGLSVARSTVRRLGGDIVLDTAYAPGARFVMTLPLAAGSPDSAGSGIAGQFVQLNK